MNTDEWQKVKEIFSDALEVESENRAAFIAESCAENSAWQAEVESLLAAHENATEIYETSAFAAIFGGDGLTNNQPKQIGNYRIVREIGRGGMGAVYEAERADGEFRRKVAVKIIKNSFGGAESVRRFRQERQILAALEHPFIARLLDGGTTNDGLPFLVMELVAGVPLGEFCEQNNVSLDERLNLFLQICEAVSFAHRNLVVHRDLKPSNVLVTAEKVPKLLDFGIAKLLDANLSETSIETQTAVRLMTPAYASPEQQRGETVTTATDVYSLGVILSELIQSFNSKIQN